VTWRRASASPLRAFVAGVTAGVLLRAHGLAGRANRRLASPTPPSTAADGAALRLRAAARRLLVLWRRRSPGCGLRDAARC
jgi:hypothetical protein